MSENREGRDHMSRPGEFLSVNLGIMPTKRRPSTMSDAECLKRWGTISIGLDSMLNHIRMATPTVWPDGTVTWKKGCELNAWLFLEFVPEHLKELARDGLQDAVEKNCRRKLTSDTARAYIVDAHVAILERLEDRETWREFCEEWRRIGARAMHDSNRYTDDEIHRHLTADDDR